MKVLTRFRFAAAAVGVLLFTGCSSITNSHLQKEPLMAEYLAGKDARVELRLSEKLKSALNTGDELMWRLEAGAFFFNIGDYRRSVNEFERAEALIADYDDRPTVSVRDAGGEGGALLTNLNALPYRGFGRDPHRALDLQIVGLSRRGEAGVVFRSAPAAPHRSEGGPREVPEVLRGGRKIAGRGEEAQSRRRLQRQGRRCRRGRPERQCGIQRGAGRNTENRASRLRKLPESAALFLSGLGSLLEGDADNARIDWARLYEALPSNPLVRQLYVTILDRTKQKVPEDLKEVRPFDFPLDRDCVYVLFANGRSAAFRQVAIYYPVMTAYPVCEYYPAPYRFLKVIAGGQSGETRLLSDMDAILAQEYDERLPGMIARIVLSTAIKEGAGYAGAWAVGRENEAAGAAVLLASMVYRAAFNTADTRSWEILPKEFQFCILPMPENRTVVLEPDGRKSGERSVVIPEADRSAIVYVNAPAAGELRVQVLGLPQ